jgi:homoserine dehydrogenase
VTTFDLILIGFGNVARRLVRLLDELDPVLRTRHGVATRLVGVTTRSRGSRFDARGLDTADLFARFDRGSRLGRERGSPMAFLRSALRGCATPAREGRLVVVELTTLDVVSGQPAIDYVRTALRGGAHVVTANKGPAAFAWRALEAEATKANRCFRFESAVLDGVPLFNLERWCLPGVTIQGFQGVVNSTTNYILTAMERGESFDAAIETMQRAGIAEADPSLDVDGWDAAAKTAVLANALLDARLTPHAIEREGVSAADSGRMAAARTVGRTLKLVASAERVGNGVRGRVRLVDLPATELLAQLEGQQNAVVLQTDRLGEIAIVQRGGGLTQTAYGLVCDIVDISRQVTRAEANRAATPRSRREAPPDRNPSPPGRRRS